MQTDASITQDSGIASVRAVIVDDHAMFRRGLVHLLSEMDIDVIGQASSGRAGVQLATELRPDLVLMDIDMPGLSGVEATQSLGVSVPSVRVVVLSASEDVGSAVDALVAGAVGYLPKDAPLEEIADVVRLTSRGETAVPPRIGSELLRRLRAQRRKPEPQREQLALSARELGVLRLVVEGRENLDIAAELFISPNTVKNHVANILKKLGAGNRLQAAVQAVRRGLVS